MDFAIPEDLSRDVIPRAAEIFGAASLGEGTQDIQKLVIFREFMKSRQMERGTVG